MATPSIPSTIPKALQALKDARYPEAIFGEYPAEVQSVYRRWAKVVHEDKASTARLKGLAHEAFLLLSALLAQAESKVSRGTYGDLKPSVMATFRTKTAAYELTGLISHGEIADLYEATVGGKACVVKVGRAPLNNDLLKAEADLLASLPAKLAKPEQATFFPTLLDSFETQQGTMKLRANVFAAPTGDTPTVSLATVRAAHPKGLDPKDAAWMWNRLLEALHLLHLEGYVHGNVTPDRFLINPDTHRGMLIDFCYAVKTGSKGKAISPAWKGIYPEELLAKKGLDGSSDVYMAAQCMHHLLGGEIGKAKMPGGIPVAIAGLLRACWLGRAHRTKTAQDVHKAFKVVRDGLRWPKGFRPFVMPPAAAAA